MRYLKNYISIFFVLLLVSLHTQAQKSPKPYVTGSAYFDSLKNQKPSIKPTGDFDQRFSFIRNNNTDINIWGYRVGLLVNDKYKFGIGGYTFNADFDRNDTAKSKTQAITSLSQVSQKIFFGTIYIEPYLIRRRRWEMSMVMELGYGRVKLDSTSRNKYYNIVNSNNRSTYNVTRSKDTIISLREPFVPIGIGLSFNLIIPDKKGWHFLTYFGLNAIVGMRTVIYDTDLKQNYSGFYYSLGTAIYIDRIFTDISGKKKQKKVTSPTLN